MLGHTPKILIVEDDLNNHPLFKEAFEAVGFEVWISQSAEGDFTTAVADFKPDLISMDLMIGRADAPNMRDGFEAIELLKADDRTKNIPIIVLSNFSGDDKIQRARSLGVVDYYNLQGQSITQVAKRFFEYVKKPRKYKPSHPLFRE